MKFPKKISLKNHPKYDESYIQDALANDPSILGLGDLELKDKERIQPRAGRLDLLLQDTEIQKRYEVEIQLGEVDESHIIRTIEYWDIERKRYPQYDHCAVIVAENITTRFFNVISLFNSSIPLIAIQMDAYELDGEIITTFTKILDEITLGMIDEDEPIQEIRDRAYWEEQATKETVSIVDDIVNVVNQVSDGHEPKYNKHYIGLTNAGKVDNFIYFKPRKKNTLVHIRVPKNEELELTFKQHDVDVEFIKNHYRFHMTKNDIISMESFFKEMIQKII